MNGSTCLLILKPKGVTISGLDNLKDLEELDYEVWDDEDGTFICKTISYVDEDDDHEMLSYDDLQDLICIMCVETKCSRSEITIHFNFTKE